MLNFERLPLRLRLTLWYSLGVAISFWAIGVASIWLVHHAIVDLENNELYQRVRSVRRFLEDRPATETQASRSSAITAAYSVSHGSKWLQVIDQDGKWLYRSPRVAEVYPHLALPQELKTSSQYFTYTTGDLHVSALISPIEVNGIHYTVQTGLTLNKSLVILSNVRYQLLLLFAAGLLLSTFGGYFMSRKALQPVAMLAEEAQRITDKNLDTRLPVLQSRDELAALSRTLNQMLERIDAGYQSIRSFTADAAHELRTPVARINAEAEVMLSLPRDAAAYRASLENVQSTSIQMSHLIDQLLRLARSDAGVEILTFERLSLDELIQEVGAHWEDRFEDAGIVFTVYRCQSWIRGDYLSLKRVLNILLENAWRYVPTGSTVSLETHERDHAVEIAVVDTGKGIPMPLQSKIFQRFSRGGRSLRGDFAGSGLGLTIAQWIVASHQSSIELESKDGQGCRFSFLFATCPAPEMAAPHHVLQGSAQQN